MATTERALIVDNDAALSQSLAEQFERLEGVDAFGARTGEQALNVVEDHQFSMILIDVGLPDIDGRDLCRLMRRQGVRAPIIMLSADDTDADMILSLDSGANDYIAKPLRLGVLRARVRAQLRQFRLSDDAIFPIGPYSFHPSTKMLIETETERLLVTLRRGPSDGSWERVLDPTLWSTLDANPRLKSCPPRMLRVVDIGMTRTSCGSSRRALPGIVRRAQRRGGMGFRAHCLRCGGGSTGTATSGARRLRLSSR